MSNRFCKQEKKLQKEVSYFDVTTRTRLAEVWREYLRKGQELRPRFGVPWQGLCGVSRWCGQEYLRSCQIITELISLACAAGELYNSSLHGSGGVPARSST